MKFSQPKRDPRIDWHKWFAWRPVRIRAGDGNTGPVVWFETIERKFDYLAGYDGRYLNIWYRESR